MIKNAIEMEDYYNLISSYFLPEDISTIVEVGSLNAQDSIYLKNKYPLSSVYAIEGLKDNFDLYMSGIKEVKCYNTIINSYDGVTKYHKKDVNGIHGIYDRGEEFGTDVLEEQPCKTLTTFAKENNIKSLDIIKIDVEGATLDVLLGTSEELLDSIKMMHLETETYPFFQGQLWLHEDVVKFLEPKFSLVGSTRVQIDTLRYQYDTVWINKKYVR